MNKLTSNVACAGMDVHYKFSNVTFRDDKGKVVSRQRLDHPDRPKLRQRLAQWPPGLPVIMEASFGWGWLSDLMDEYGLDVHLSNCFKIERMRQARGGVKTNKKDADLLSLLGFEQTDWWTVWRAPSEVRNRREQMRFRADLVAMQTAVKSRIHAVFHRHGIFHDFSDLFGAKGRMFLNELCMTNTATLSAEALAALRGQVKLLDHLRRQLADVTRVLHRQMARTPLTLRLKTVPGIGLILAHVLAAEIGCVGRFRTHKALASHSLLAPRSSDTGEADPRHSPQGRHLGGQGNRTLKWAWIEAAHGAVRSGGRWREMFERVTDGGRKDRGRGYIKGTRELVKVTYAVWSKGADYRDVRPARGGRDTSMSTSKRKTMSKSMSKCTPRRKPSRSGTGQLYHPMVHALPA